MGKHVTLDGFSGQSTLDSFLDEIQSVSDIESLWNACTQTLKEYGFTHVTYLLIRLSAPHDSPIVLSNLPKWWSDIYLDREYVCSDPLFRFCGNLKPRRTGSDYLDTYPDISLAERERVLSAGDAGCRTGFASPVRLISARRCGGWNFGSTLPRERFETHYQKVRDQVRLIGFYAHERLEAISAEPASVLESASVLSQREQECLTFLARGKRTSSIAGVLGISAATVEFHLKNVKRKLGASTREEALAKAIEYGEISLSR
ncbi:MAG: LuxR C-terminal-related transcriptional regulator [Pseudomonadota bacterium]